MLLSQPLGPLGGFALFIVSICGPVSRPRGWRRGHRNAWKQRCQEKKKGGHGVLRQPVILQRRIFRYILRMVVFCVL